MMWLMLDSLRKKLFTPTGYGIYTALMWQLLFFGGRVSIFSIVESALMGFAMSAFVMFRGPRKRAFEIAGRNKMSTLREFKKLVQQEKAPKDAELRAEYLEYVNALAAVYERRSMKTEIGSFIFLIFMLVLYLITVGHGFTAILFAAVIAFAMYGTFRSRITLKRIYAIKKKYFSGGDV